MLTSSLHSTKFCAKNVVLINLKPHTDSVEAELTRFLRLRRNRWRNCK